MMVGHVAPSAIHIGGDYDDLYGELLGPLGIDLVRYDIDEGRLPTSLTECDAWLCSPSRASTYDDLPWIADAEDLLRAMIAEEHLFVGICFGHQLLAQALGGRVAKAEAGWGVGALDYDVTVALPFMDRIVERLTMIATHQDQVVDTPGEATVWATADYCPNAGMAVGDRAWTFQGHPEFSAEVADVLYAGRVELIGQAKVDGARASLTKPLSRQLMAHWIAVTVGAG
jgi:GMP synthase-like glutamine amidotransferase